MGKTKKGKGTKLLLLTDAQGLPLSGFTASAQVSEVNTVETLVDIRVVKKKSARLVDDKNADADWLRAALQLRGIEQITHHRRGRKNPLNKTDEACDAIDTGGRSKELSVGYDPKDDCSSGTNTMHICSKAFFTLESKAERPAVVTVPGVLDDDIDEFETQSPLEITSLTRSPTRLL